MEGKLGRILGRIRAFDTSPQSLETQARVEEISRTLRASMKRHNRARTRLSEMGLSEESLGLISSAVRAGMAEQKAEDDIYWRAALTERYKLGTVNDIHRRKEVIELEIEMESPRFSTDVSDSTS